MESKRISTGGRRGAKKDVSNSTTKATTKQKRKGADEANVLRTRSGRTRTAASSDKTTATRKKASSAKTSNNDPNQLKEDSSEIQNKALDMQFQQKQEIRELCAKYSLNGREFRKLVALCERANNKSLGGSDTESVTSSEDVDEINHEVDDTTAPPPPRQKEQKVFDKNMVQVSNYFYTQLFSLEC